MNLKAIVLGLFIVSVNFSFSQSVNDTIKIQSIQIESETSVDKIHILDSVELSNPQHLNVGELLSKKSHLFVKSYGIGSLSSISLRGSASAHTKLYWNGIGINSSMNGSTDVSLIPLYFIDEVELNYGLKSLADGAGGIGGTVHLNSIPKFIKQQGFELTTKFGSFGQKTYTTGFIVGTNNIQSTTKFYFNQADNNFEYKDLTLEGFPLKKVRNAYLEQKGISQNVAFRIKENKILQANFWFFSSKRNLPPLITLRNNIEYQNDENFKGLLKYKLFQKDGLFKLTFSSAFLADELVYRNERASVNTKLETNSYRNRIDFKTVPLHEFIVVKAQLKYNIEQANSPSIEGKLKRNQLGAFVNTRLIVSKKITTDIEARYLIIMTDNQYIMPSIMVNYRPTKKSSFEFFTRAGKNVNYPTLNDLNWEPFGNKNLKAEESESFEIGVANNRKYYKNIFSLEYKIAAFYSDINNYILWQPTAFGFWRPINLKKVETKGVEGNINFTYKSKKWESALQTSYSYTESTNREKQHEFDESSGKQLIYIPIHKANINGLLYVNKYSLSINYQILGRRFISSDNDEFLPSYQILDVNIGKKVGFKKNILELTVGIKNLFATEYQAIEWRPMPNRNYFIELTYRFKK